MATAPEKEAVTDTYEQSKPAFLRRVQIRGYKSIAFCDVTLEPLTILVGRNASGKSNFLDALAFLRDCVQLGVPEAVQRRGNMQTLLCRSRDSDALTFEIETHFTAGPNQTEHQARYRLNIPVAHRDGLLTYGEPEEWVSTKELPTGQEVSCKLGGPPPRELRFFRGPIGQEKESGSLPLVIPSGHLMFHYLASSPYIEWADALGHMNIYNFLPDVMRKLHQPNPGQMLDQNGQNLARVLAATQQYDYWASQRIGRYFFAVVPEVERFDRVCYGDFETLHFWLTSNGPDGKKMEFDASSMSDGTLRVLAALTAVFQKVSPWRYPSVVGIEEPEAALHPAAMRALVAAMDEATLRTQILLTTHSPDLLDAAEIKPSNVRVVQMIDGQTVIGPVDEAGMEIVARRLNSLGGLERENQLEPDIDDQERQRQLSNAHREDRP